jgi:hypothetical protein
MNLICNKKILLFYPYGATKHYGDCIRDELRRQGALVFEFDERPSQNPLIKAIIRVLRKKIHWIFNFYIKKIIFLNKKRKFDYVLVLRGEAFNKKTIKILRRSYPRSKIILYVWDVLDSIKLQDVIPYFDKAFSFDPEDVRRTGNLNFRPTFFLPQFKELSKREQKDIDVLFIGTLHSNRYEMIDTLKLYFEANGISFFSYLYVPSRIALFKHLYIEKIKVNKRHIHFEPISLSRTVALIERSKSILDLNYTGQKSLSMRAFEAMASKTKYITTNEEVKKYDFYNKNNIFVFSFDKISITKDFLDSPFEDVSTDVLERYSVERLVGDLFCNNNQNNRNPG